MAVGTPTRVAGPIAQHLDSPGPVSSSTTGSFTPVAGSLLVAVLTTGDFGAAIGTQSISNTHAGSWSWTQLTQIHEATYSRMSLYYAIVPTSPGNGTITFTYTNNRETVAANVYEITGVDTSTPVVQSKLATGTGTSRSTTLDSTPASDSLIFGFVADSWAANVPTITPGAGYTTLHQTNSPGIADNGGAYTMYRNGGTGTTVNATNLSTDSYGSGIIAIEVAAATAPEPRTSRILTTIYIGT
jgi:hypothetical protein